MIMKTSTLVGMLGAVSLLAACAATKPTFVASSAPSAPPPASAAAPTQTAAAGSKPSDPAAAESLTIDFPNDSDTLSDDAKAQMDHAARLYRDAKPEVMIITGHTDTTGTEFANVILSAKRAAAVKQALTDRGIPADRLEIVADGEAEPVVGVLPSRTAVVTWR
jgi:outer membrane protein OmpA-like peptidoglycan-associated protein